MHGEATAKAILFGEHAVVHGVPAVAVPLAARRTEVDLVPLDSTREIAIEAEGPGGGPLATGSADLALAREMVRLALDQAPGVAARGARARVRSNVPLGAGLGSSAALAVALVRAAGGAGLGVEEVARRALELEKLAHGTPSGIDSTVIAHGRPIAFRRGEAAEPLRLGAPLRLIVAVFPRRGTTASLVDGVRRLAKDDPERFRATLDAIRKAAELGRTYLERGDLPMVGVALSANHGALRALGVSTPTLDEACEAACQAGALGAKMSGAGGGGAALALLAPGVDPGPVIAAFIRSGAREAFEAAVQ